MSFKKTFEHSDSLFEAALDEFIDRGYEQASINTILQKAGMSKGQFYYHFQNKEGLYLALIGVLIEKKQEFLAKVMQPEDFHQDIFGIFRTQIRYGVMFAREYPAINRFSESFLREKGSAIYHKALETYNFQDNAGINRLIDMAQGQFREDLPLPFIKRVIGYLFTHAAEIVDANQADAFEDEMNHLIEFMKTGLTRNR
jgi:TetR/AcrR family transcriptional regulator